MLTAYCGDDERMETAGVGRGMETKAAAMGTGEKQCGDGMGPG